ncbi:MAG TPA: YbjN domain-containing protein [Anaerolinea thermolimosa]|uniref:YbjN domain-containing protein n=1 Tax=Anaerolinea thermolimosa TaxID=229919 RepID=A0A3D1JJR4_9CHLR|nr:YbjN domain-containing protein [Anaerolinea thermolimosa]GAP05451.1 uncharacterized conserved protein [Anaerolinea thermolimosa]HCE18475.1 YbjN domain-containing protein [Anaerolinea thermolimosa]
MTPEDEPLSESSSHHPNSLRAFDVLGRFLEEDGWYPRRVGGKYSYSMTYNGRHGDLRCYAIIRVDVEEFLFYAIAPVKIPEEVRPAVAEYLTRANYGLRIGNFELDYADGEVRYKSSLGFAGQELTVDLISNAIYPAVHTMDRYLPGLLRVSYGGATPFEAIEEVEGGMQDKEA